MTVLAVINPKGGSGKSTVATHVAAYWAKCGHRVVLGDVDRQQSCQSWLEMRSPNAAHIGTWASVGDNLVQPPAGTTHLVLDTPAGLHGGKLLEILKLANKVLIPVLPGTFDILAADQFFTELRLAKRTRDLDIALMGMRIDARTRAAARFSEYVEYMEYPTLANVDDSQIYVEIVAQGLTIFDDAERYQGEWAQWQEICDWLDA